MFVFERQRFFDDFTPRTGLKLSDQRRKELDFLLSKLEQDDGFTLIRELAYVLATVRWETMHTFLPLKEKRFSRERNPRAWENQNRYWKTGFYGRGYVQITWEENYKKAGKMLSGEVFTSDDVQVAVEPDTFLKNPDLVLNPEAAYLICSRGMREGWFTRKKLGDYIQDGTPPDYFNARRIINGTDHAEDIQIMANQFELLLRASA